MQEESIVSWAGLWKLPSLIRFDLFREESSGDDSLRGGFGFISLNNTIKMSKDLYAKGDIGYMKVTKVRNQ